MPGWLHVRSPPVSRPSHCEPSITLQVTAASHLHHRYLDLFDTQRASNIVLCKYYTEKAGRTFDLSRATGSGAVSTPSSSSRPSRPAISDWRPGGML